MLRGPTSTGLLPLRLQPSGVSGQWGERSKRIYGADGPDRNVAKSRGLERSRKASDHSGVVVESGDLPRDCESSTAPAVGPGLSAAAVQAIGSEVHTDQFERVAPKLYRLLLNPLQSIIFSPAALSVDEVLVGLRIGAGAPGDVANNPNSLRSTLRSMACS